MQLPRTVLLLAALGIGSALPVAIPDPASLAIREPEPAPPAAHSEYGDLGNKKYSNDKKYVSAREPTELPPATGHTAYGGGGNKKYSNDKKYVAAREPTEVPPVTGHAAYGGGGNKKYSDDKKYIAAREPTELPPSTGHIGYGGGGNKKYSDDKKYVAAREPTEVPPVTGHTGYGGGGNKKYSNDKKYVAAREPTEIPPATGHTGYGGGGNKKYSNDKKYVVARKPEAEAAPAVNSEYGPTCDKYKCPGNTKYTPKSSSTSLTPREPTALPPDSGHTSYGGGGNKKYSNDKKYVAARQPEAEAAPDAPAANSQYGMDSVCTKRRCPSNTKYTPKPPSTSLTPREPTVQASDSGHANGHAKYGDGGNKKYSQDKKYTPISPSVTAGPSRREVGDLVAREPVIPPPSADISYSHDGYGNGGNKKYSSPDHDGYSHSNYGSGGNKKYIITPRVAPTQKKYGPPTTNLKYTLDNAYSGIA